MLATFLPLLPIVLVLCLLAIRFWSVAIIVALIWAMFEGAVRKWVFPGFQSYILLIKDFVLISAYLGYYVTVQKNNGLGAKSGTLLFLLGLEAMYCVFQLFNSNSPSILLGLFGLKNYLIYIPLAFIIPDMINTRERLEKVAIVTCLIAIPIGLLGLYQFSQPPGSWINEYVSHEEGVQSVVSVFGQGEGDFQYGRVRTSSTFSYIGGFTTFVMLAVPLAGALLLAGVAKRRNFFIVVLALIASIGGAVTTGSRTPIFIFAFSAPLMVMLATAKGFVSFRSAVRLAIGLAIVSGIALLSFETAISAFEYRATNSDSGVARLVAPITETLAAFETSPVFGTGIGTNSNASLAIMGHGLPWWLNGYAYEMESARVMQELGLIGMVLVYLPKLFVIILIAAHLRKSRAPLMIALHMAALFYVLPHFVLFTVNNPTGGLIYWTMVGISIAAYRVETAERRMMAEQQFYVDRGYPVGELAMG